MLQSGESDTVEILVEREQSDTAPKLRGGQIGLSFSSLANWLELFSNHKARLTRQSGTRVRRLPEQNAEVSDLPQDKMRES